MTNLHTHTTFCDGKNTVEEFAKVAIEKGFSSLGFSGHGYTEYDLRYCMKDMDGYIAEVKRIKEKYKGKIEIYVGVEEDSHSEVCREKFDYLIGSCHYLWIDGNAYPLDSNYDYFKICLKACGGDAIRLAKEYYEQFCQYILRRKPDIIGHFDLPTKFDEREQCRFLQNKTYWKIAEEYLERALRAGCIFEVNTGLMARGYRSSPCPHERLLKIIAKKGGKVTLSSDAHQVETLGYGFEEVKKLLRDVGFCEIYTFESGKWIANEL